MKDFLLKQYRRNYFLMISFSISLLFLFIGCKKILDYYSYVKPIYIVMTNTNDPLFLQYKSKDTTVDIFGTRDELGNPSVITDYIIKIGKDTSYYKFEQDMRISSFTAPNQTKFLFNWTGPNIAVVTVLAKDGTTQLTTQIDFNNPQQKINRNNQVLQRPSTPIQVDFTPKSENPITTLATGNVNITVTQCSNPTDVENYLIVKSVNGTIIGTFPSQRISKGVFGVSLPSNTAPTSNISQICNNLANTIGLGCYASQLPSFPLFCPALSAVIASTGIGASVAAPIFSACTYLVTGLEIYCKIFDFNGVPGAPSLAEKLCSSTPLNRTLTGDILISAYAIGIPTNTYSIQQRVPGNGPYPTVNINLGSATKVRTFRMTPPTPIVGQSYDASIDVFCLKPGSTVKISVIGTDGYSNTITYPISTTLPDGVFTLTVPGAISPGIVDYVTFQITLPDGASLTRSAFLVFK